MSLSLNDHHRRIHDLEVALVAAVGTLGAANASGREALAAVEARLRANGERSAAELPGQEQAHAVDRR